MNLCKSTKEWSKLQIDDATDLALLDLKNQDQLIEKLGQANIVKINEFKNYVEIQTYAYVGRLQVGNLELTINPKIDDLPFLQLLNYTFELDIIQHFPETNQSLGVHGFLELLLYRLSTEIQTIVRAGLFKKYISLNKDLNTIRGQVDFNRLSQTSSSYSANIPCRYFNRIEDNLLNQVLLAGGLYARTLSRNSFIRNALIRNLGIIQNEIRKIELNRQVIRSATSHINRLNNNYAKALKLISLVYNSSGILFNDSDEDVFLDGFLLNMNYFFQNLITKFLSQSLNNYKIFPEQNIANLFRYMPKYNPKKKRNPLPRPDITLIKDKTTIIFIDTKYIDLWEKDIPSSILYQLSIYVLSLNAPYSKAIILYPTLSEEALDSIIEITNPLNNLIKSYVIIRPVNLIVLLELINSNNKIEDSRFSDALVDVSIDI